MGKCYSIKGKCYFCENNAIEHHISYTPEIVVYLCKKCHGKLHIIIKVYHDIIKKKDNGLRETEMKKIILSDNIKDIDEVWKIMNMSIKKSDKVKRIAETKCITTRHARRILNKLEQIEDEIEDKTPDN